MISKIRAGIISCIGLIIINLINGLIIIPNFELDNLMIARLIILVGYLWFSISLWIVIKYDFVIINELEEFEKPLNWLIKNIAIVSGASIVSIVFPNRDFYYLILFLGLILAINYLIVFIKIYRLDKNELENVGALHDYIISVVIILIIDIIVNVFNEFKWRIDLDYLFNIFNAIPIIFLIRFLNKEKKNIEHKQSIYSIHK